MKRQALNTLRSDFFRIPCPEVGVSVSTSLLATTQGERHPFGKGCPIIFCRFGGKQQNSYAYFGYKEAWYFGRCLASSQRKPAERKNTHSHTHSGSRGQNTRGHEKYGRNKPKIKLQKTAITSTVVCCQVLKAENKFCQINDHSSAGIGRDAVKAPLLPISCDADVGFQK